MVAPLFSSYAVIHYQRKQVRKQVKKQLIAGLPTTSLLKMTFSKKDSQEKLDWKHAREFSYMHEMYDVVSQTDLGDSVQYLLWWDSEETQLNQQLKQLLVQQAGKKSAGKDTAYLLHSFFKTLCFTTPYSLSYSVPFFYSVNRFFFIIVYTAPFIEKLTPPPDHAACLV